MDHVKTNDWKTCDKETIELWLVELITMEVASSLETVGNESLRKICRRTMRSETTISHPVRNDCELHLRMTCGDCPTSFCCFAIHIDSMLS